MLESECRHSLTGHDLTSADMRLAIPASGGKWTCGLSRLAEQKEVVVYSFGINGESSFEEEILKRVPGSQVWGYDFSVKSVSRCRRGIPSTV